MFATVFIGSFVFGILAASFRREKGDTVVHGPSEEWSFDPVDGPGWFKFTLETNRD